MYNVFIFNNIRDYLLANPGSFKWSANAEIWNIDLTDLYSHLSFLRINGFTRNDRGRVYWEGGDIADVRGLLAQQRYADSPVPEKIKIEKISTHIGSHKDLLACTDEIRKIAFCGLNIVQLAERLTKPYKPALIHKAAINAGAKVVFSSQSRYALYFKFNSESDKISS